MAKQAHSAQSVNPSSVLPSFIHVLSEDTGAVLRLPVPANTVVEYYPIRFREAQRHYLMVFVGNDFVGLHCGDRTGDLISFIRKSDADRLARVRNAAWKAARRSVEEVA